MCICQEGHAKLKDAVKTRAERTPITVLDPKTGNSRPARAYIVSSSVGVEAGIPPFHAVLADGRSFNRKKLYVSYDKDVFVDTGKTVDKATLA